MRIKVLIALVFLFVLTAIAVRGQEDIKKVSESSTTVAAEAKFAEVRSRLRGPLPFQPGERLTYELKLSRFPFYGVIGELTFNVDEETAPTTPQEQSQEGSQQVQPAATAEEVRPSFWKLQAEAQAKGILTSIFRYNVQDLFVSYVDKNDFGVIKTEKKVEEGKKKQESTANFDRARRMVKWTNKDLNKPNYPLDIKEKETFGWVTDIVAGWYVLRAQPLKVGEKVSIPLSDNGETYEVEIEPLGYDKVDMEIGKFSTMKIEMRLFNGKFFRRKGRLFLWVTDDDRHLPVRAQIKFESGFGGTVNINLIQMEKVKGVDGKVTVQQKES